MFLFLFFSFHLIIGGPILDGIKPRSRFCRYLCCIGPFKFSCALLLCRYFLLVIYSYFLVFDSVEVTLDIINFI